MNTLTRIEQNNLLQRIYKDFIDLQQIGFKRSQAVVLLCRKFGYKRSSMQLVLKKQSEKNLESFLNKPDSEKTTLVPNRIELQDIYSVLTN